MLYVTHVPRWEVTAAGETGDRELVWNCINLIITWLIPSLRGSAKTGVQPS